ncbi:MAG TPA: hypothetical protein VLE73_03115 [Candidatus Saccharimonadales bacterium]|nr:hypothetical protein [Candidatus Saccharimonadales bacterium]
MKNEHQTLLGRVCLHHETTYSNLSMRRTCMTFQDIAIGLRREVQFPPD